MNSVFDNYVKSFDINNNVVIGDFANNIEMFYKKLNSNIFNEVFVEVNDYLKNRESIC